MDKVQPIIIASNKNWIEGEAIRQLEITANLNGMKRAVGLPDLHPGKGIPIGAAYLSEGIIYPHLVGNDIGCGMSLWQTDLKKSKFKLDKCVKKLTGFEEVWSGDSEKILETYSLPKTLWPMALGTIGSGNHFAELQCVDTVFNENLLQESGLQKNKITLLVHSGSRGLGQSILEAHISKFGGKGLNIDTPEFTQYIHKHNQAITWAEANRFVIAQRFVKTLKTEGTRLLEVCHNSVTPHQNKGWLHRKGASPTDKGLVIVPGSRGTYSYVVKPRTENADISLSSLAHGAGRKWKRSDAKARLFKKHSVSALTRTALGGRVICEDKALIYEEAPEAYKDINIIIADMQDAGLIDIIATLRPLITYKTRRK